MQMNPYQTYQQAPTMTYSPGFNAYQYNPMQNVQQRLPQEQMQPQQVQQPAPMSGMVGKMVGRIEDIAPQDVPMTGIFSKTGLIRNLCQGLEQQRHS